MDNKLNIEEIKYLIPDYITGSLNDKDKLLVENAIQESSELREMYEDMSGAFRFVSNAKFKEPPAQYWNTLLPKIHEKIEAKSSKKFSWGSASAIWKIIIPAAAVLLIFIVYQLLKSPEDQMTKKEKEEKQIENIQKDSGNNTKQEIKEEKKQKVETKENDVVKENPVNIKTPKLFKKNKIINEPKVSFDNVAQDNKASNNENIKENNDRDNEEFASIDPDDISVFSGNPADGIDDETESELNKLNTNEKDQLIEDLMKSNL